MAGPDRAAGYQDYSSSAANRFIPEVYSGKLVQKFYSSTVFGSICSTDYEGEIRSFGDNIIIRTQPDVTVSDYAIGSTFDVSDYQTPSSDAVELSINRAKKFLIRVNTVDRFESDVDMVDLFTDDASRQLQISMDRDLLATAPAQAAAENQGVTAGAISGNINLGSAAAPVALDESSIVDYILGYGQVLDEQNVADEGRWLVLPAWAIRALKASDLKAAYLTGDSQTPLRNGRVGMVDRFTIFQSNNLTVSNNGTNDYTNIIGGHSAGLAWASQITEMGMMENFFDFGFVVRGLCVYGFKVIAPKYIAYGRIRQG